jgi:hypothetical protein
MPVTFPAVENRKPSQVDACQVAVYFIGAARRHEAFTPDGLEQSHQVVVVFLVCIGIHIGPLLL